MEYGYKHLEVWKKAIQLVKIVYALAKQLPPEEKYALSDQIRRAVVSIPSNIAEGNGRASNRDYAHFLAIARGSLYETMTQLDIAQELGYIGGDDSQRQRMNEAESLALELRKMLTAMINRFS